MRFRTGSDGRSGIPSGPFTDGPKVIFQIPLIKYFEGNPDRQKISPPADGEDSHHVEKIPEYLGSFKVLRLLGRGGMGQVYLAEDSFKRKVALKLLRRGFDSEENLARFKLEVNTLARLSHPSICHIYEAGTFDSGRVFFSMEYFPGVSITRFCEENRLGIRERLNLFLLVCEGVKVIHQKSLLHRDLKPSNILVRAQDGRLVVKIIDFGIVRNMTRQSLEELERATLPGAVMGSLAYMSPEQASGLSLDLDTRSDVYSLGLVLFEMLTGCPAFEVSDFKNLPYDRVLKAIRCHQPTQPSKALARRLRGENRSVRLRLTKKLKGELDWIVAKALANNREERYGTVLSFANDLNRYLTKKPVGVAPPNFVYLLKKFTERHRLAVLLAFAFFDGIGGLNRHFDKGVFTSQAKPTSD